jgi:phosphotransferase system HPr (HPr) family protein
MNGETLESKVVITNPQGFHMRPITAFAELAGRFASQVRVGKDSKRVNGKSPLEMMILGAEKGSELQIEVSGPDAKEALAALVDLLNNLGNEEESDPPLPNKKEGH